MTDAHHGGEGAGMAERDATRPKGEIVPFLRGEPRVPHADETKTLALILYATSGARSPAAVEKLLPSYLEPMGLPTPTRQAIARWAREENWNGQADDLWRSRPTMFLDELARLTTGTLLVLAKQMHDMATGLDTRPIEERMLTTKQYEVGMRVAKDVPRATTYVPPQAEVQTDGMSRDEIEARARQALKPGRESRA